MGRIFDLLKNAGGQKSLHDPIGRWRQAITLAVEAISGGSLTFQTETGTNLPVRPVAEVDWLTVEDIGGKTVLRPHSQLPRITAAVRADTDINIAAPPAAIDGYTLESADVVWLTGQTNPAEDGFYIVNRVGGGFTPATELNAFVAASFAYVKVINGVTYAGQFFRTDAIGTQLPDPGFDWMVVDIDDFYLTADAGDHLPAFNRARDSGAGLVTLRRRPRYDFSDACVGNHKLTVEGLGTIREPNLTECVFNGSHGFSALAADATPDSQGGYIALKGLWIRYAGSNLEASAFHGLNLETQCIVEQCTVENFPGHGIHSVADEVIEAEVANVRCSSCRVIETGLSGVYTGGNNSSVFSGVAVARCGRRLLGAVRSQWVLRLTNTTGSNVNITAGNQVWKDTRRGLYFISVNVGSGLIPSGGGTLDITIEAYNGSLEAQLIGAGQDPWGPGTRFGHGTEYDLPNPNAAFNIGAISTRIYSLENLTGVTASNPSGTPSVPAVLGDAHNFFDDTDQGSTYTGCGSKDPGVRHFLSVKFGGSTFIGGRCSTGYFGQVMPPNMRIGGKWGDPPGVPNNGLLRNTAALETTDLIAKTKSVGDTTVRIARALTNEIFHFFTGADAAGYKLQQGVGGRQTNSYAMERGDSGALCALAFTQPTDQRGAGHTLLTRGPIFGNSGIRMNSSSLAGSSGPPATSTTADVWNVGDIWFDSLATTGNPWMYRCTAKAGGAAPNALTWTAALNAP